MRTTEQRRDFVPTVRVAQARAADSDHDHHAARDDTGFRSGEYLARANGYIETRKVDIGDHVKAGDLLARLPLLNSIIRLPGPGHSQPESGDVAANQASRDLAQVTYDRDSALVKKGWVTPQQGDTDRLTLEAQKAAIDVAQVKHRGPAGAGQRARSTEGYQRVVAPFDGIITQRSVDAGSLVQSGSTLMFSLMQSNVIRIQVYVPQDAAFGVATGVDAVVRVPEMPDRTFPGKVTRFPRRWRLAHAHCSPRSTFPIPMAS